MSDSPQSRRSFIKGSVSKSLPAANAGIVAGLISAPGVAGANTTGYGTTQPQTTGGSEWRVCTWQIRKTLSSTAQSTQHTAAGLAAADAAYQMANPWTIEPGTPSGAGVSTPTYTGTISGPYSMSRTRNPSPPVPTSVLDSQTGLYVIVYDYSVTHTKIENQNPGGD